MSDPTVWVEQVVKLTREPVRFVPEKAQNNQVGHLPTATATARGVALVARVRTIVPASQLMEFEAV